MIADGPREDDTMPDDAPAVTATLPTGWVARHVVRPDDDVPAVLTRLYSGVVRDRGTVHVVQLTRPQACDLGIEIVVAASIGGDVVAYRDATPGAPPPEPDALTGRSTPPGAVLRAEIVSLRRPRVDGAAVAALRGARAAVLVVDATTSRAVLGDAVEMLDGLGVDLGGVVEWAGRVPRDPSWALAPRFAPRVSSGPRPGSRNARGSAPTSSRTGGRWASWR